MYPMHAAKRAELLQFQPLGLGLLVLGLAVVLTFAFGALQCDDFAHSFAPFSRAEVRIQKSESRMRSTGHAEF
jgi:hypothetical protein